MKLIGTALTCLVLIASGSPSLAVQVIQNFEFVGTAEGKIFVTPILPEEHKYGVTWQDALQLCADAGYRMATITSSVQNEVIREFITGETGIDSTRWSWIDGTNFISKDTWFSLNTGRNLTFFDWVSGRPVKGDDSYSLKSRCLRWSYNQMENGWWDVPCDDKHSVICETPAA